MELIVNINENRMLVVTNEQLKNFREKLGFSQEQLAKQLRVARNTISRWELGNSKIPEYLDLTLEALENRIKSKGWVEQGENGEKLFCFYAWDESENSNVLQKIPASEMASLFDKKGS